MKNARNQHRTDYAKELVKIVQTTKDREELKKKIRDFLMNLLYFRQQKKEKRLPFTGEAGISPGRSLGNCWNRFPGPAGREEKAPESA